MKELINWKNLTPDKPLYYIEFKYKNWQGQISWRQVTNISCYYGTSGYYLEPQLLINGYDMRKRAWRTYSLENILDIKEIRFN